MRMYKEGLITAATPPGPAGLPGCKALDYLETRVVPSALGPLETHAMGQEGALWPWPALASPASETHAQQTCGPRVALPVLCLQSPRESAPCLPQPGAGKLPLPSVPFLSHCWGFWVMGLCVRLLPLRRFPEALDVGVMGIAFYPGNVGHRGGKKEKVKERGSRWQLAVAL
jgi:hypothetical protein